MMLAAASTSFAELLAKVLPLAIGAAISPTILIVVLVVLGGRAHPRARGAVYSAGAILVLLVLAALSITLLRHSVTHRGGGDPVYGWIDVGFGVLLLGIAIRQLLVPAKPKQAPAGSGDGHAHLGRYFGLGVAMMLTNFSTLVLFIPAMKDVAVARVGIGAKSLTVAIAIAVASCLAWAPVLLDSVAPRLAGRILDPMNAFMTRNQRVLSIVVCFVFAAYLMFKGLRAL